MNPILLLKSDDYYSQRNNRIRPLAACMPTARVMFYLANGISFDSPPGMQPEDHFMEILNSDDAIAFCHKKYPWTTNRRDLNGKRLPDIPPNEVHGMYGSYLDGRVTGKRRSDFSTSLSWESYLKYLDNGHAIMSAGDWPGTDGHAVLFMGFSRDGETLFTADPYGNPWNHYIDAHGYAIAVTRDQFDMYVTQFPGTTGKCGHVPI